jgi:putative acyl-CoA dehydrogenase
MTPVAAEAMECLGGNGYVEESALARLYREAPLNGIWEGSANVICLDALRAIAKSREAFAALADEVKAAGDARAERLVASAAKALADPHTAESSARSIVGALALAVEASLMKRFAADEAAEAFCASRLAGEPGSLALGTLAARVDARSIVAAAAPAA